MTTVTTLVPWQKACAEKQSKQLERIPVAWRLSDSTLPDEGVKDVTEVPRKSGLLTNRELEITELDDVDLLLRRLASAEYSSVEVTTAFCKRAAIAHQVVNCLTEFWFEEAIEYAKTLDKHLAETAKPMGLLHGMPISIKDQFQVAGKECNMGWASWIGNISEVDSDLVTCLKKAGAVLYCRTNVPQTLLSAQGLNHVYGRTSNPYQRELTSGGSSAGEGALLAMRGSPVGVGTDLGGSIRIPSSFCGLYGMKSTSRRWPYGNALNVLAGLEGHESTIGPMSTNLAGCVAWMKGMTSTKPWLVDAQVVPIPWQEDLYQLEHLGGKEAKLSFGYYDFDGVTQVHPPIRRAVAMMVSALRAAGHEVIEWQPNDCAAALELFEAIETADGSEDLKRTIRESGETILPNSAGGWELAKAITVWESWQLHRRKHKYREAHLKQWVATAQSTATGRPIHGLITPATPTAAYADGTTHFGGYTELWNLMDLPAITIPVDRVKLSKDARSTTFEAVSLLDQEAQDSFDPERSEGCPTSIQLIGSKFQEEELLGLAKVASEALKAFKKAHDA